jgi:DsbC/DsbD-like thiol-disulfide interchange protein
MSPIRLLFAVALVASLAVPAASKDLGQVLTGKVLPGWQTSTGTRMVALQVDLAPGWKTYWRAPGEAGIPPHFDWTGSRNLDAVRLHWPRPVVFDQNGMRSIGYVGRMVLPIELTPRQAGQPIELRVQVDLGVCEDICIPISLDLIADLTGSGAPDAMIDAALADRPRPARSAGLTGVSCAVEPIRDGLRVTAQLDIPALGGTELAVIELPGHEVWVSEAQTRRSGGRVTATAEMVPPQAAPFSLDRSEIRLTLIGAGQAVDLTGCPG